MEHHEIKMLGPFWVEKTFSLPSSSDDFIGRVLYEENTDEIFYGTVDGWIEIPRNVFKNISVSGQDLIVAGKVIDDTLVFEGSGIELLTDPITKTLTVSGGEYFSSVTVSGSTINATKIKDNIILSSSNGISLNVDTISKEVTFIGSNNFSRVDVSGDILEANQSNDTLHLEAGDGISLTVAGKNITISNLNFSNVNSFFSTGRKIWIYEDSAPSGWTIIESAADGLLAVKSTSGTYNVPGGTRAGTWTQPTHTHSTGNTTLTEDNIPLHYHFIATNETLTNRNIPPNKTVLLTANNYIPFYVTYVFTVGSLAYRFFGSDTIPTIGRTSNYGKVSPDPHNHGTTGASSTSNTWRPLANVGIIIEKTGGGPL